MFKSLMRLGVLALVTTSAVQAAEPTKDRSVELFSAIESGEIKVELIAPSPKQVFLRVDNQTKDMLHIELPKSFAAVPVLGQFQPALGGQGMGQGLGLGAGGPGMGQLGFGQGAGGQGMGAQGGNGGSQGLGGGFNGGGAGFNGAGGNGAGNGFNNGGGGNGLGNPLGNAFGNRGGIFRVAPGKVGKVAADTVCLEFGKPDPTSRVKYQIVPLDRFSTDPQINTICQLLATGQITQKVAQAAAWHVANHLTWDQLAGLDRVQSKYTGNVRMFTSEELQAAQAISTSSEPTQSSAPQSRLSLNESSGTRANN